MVDGIALYFFADSEDQEYWVGPWRLWEREAAAAHRAADEHGQPTDEHGRLLLYDPQSLFEGTDASWVRPCDRPLVAQATVVDYYLGAV